MFGGYLIESYYFLNHFGALFVGGIIDGIQPNGHFGVSLFGIVKYVYVKLGEL